MKTMKWIDRWVGFVLCALLTPFELALPKRRAGEPDRILVIKFWGMGSMIMTDYLIRSVKSARPGAKITLLTLESNREIVKLLGSADVIETLDISQGLVAILFNIFSMLWRTFKAKYDVVFDLEYLTRFTAIVAFASRAPVRVGFYARGFYRGNFHNRKAPFNSYWHVRDNFLNQASIVGLRGTEPKCLSINPGDDGRAEANKLLEELNVTKRYIVLNPNAGETSLERRWPPDRFAKLADKAYEKWGIPSLIIGAKKERDVAQSVVNATANGKAINIAGRTSIRGLAAILAGAGAVVTNDSGPIHLASHAGAKVIGIFGPETPALWGPISGDPNRTINFFRDLDCSPCINIHNMKTVTCLKEGAECLTGISVDEVFKALVEFIDGSQNR